MKSTEKTTAAKLRSIIDEKDKVWAEDILGKSVHTIRHLEAGTLKLSPALAAKMNYETGISIKWLMDGNPDAPVSTDGRKYTKEIYDDVQARKKSFAIVDDFNVRLNVICFFRDICAILVNANRKKNYHLAFYRTLKAIHGLRTEFGEAKDLLEMEKALAFMKPTLTFAPTKKRLSKKRRR